MNAFSTMAFGLRLLLVAVVAGLAARAAPAQTIPSGGVSLVSVADVAINGSFYSTPVAGGTVAVRTTVPVGAHPSFAQAAQFETQNPTGEFWSSAVTAQSNRATANGDVVLLHFFLRAIASQDETGAAFCQVFVEGPGPGFTKSLSQQVSAGPEWLEYFIPFEVSGAYAPGDLGVKFGFGASQRPQTLELGGVEVFWYGTSRTLAEMPRTAIQYDGREADAAWRTAAAQRIEQYRKGNYEIRVVNGAGLPVPGAAVRARMRRHAFEFGTAWAASRVVNQAPVENQTYRGKLLELFNAGSAENDLKWPPWDGEWGNGFNQPQTLAALSFLKGQGFKLRGHVLVWPSVRNLPASIGPLVTANDPTVPQRIIDHIADIVSDTQAYLDEWDVLNEPYDNHDVMDRYGEAVMADWFEEARARHPSARLFINDYGILSGGGLNVPKQNSYIGTISEIKAGGGPIDGIGFQGHFDASPTGIPKVWSVLERFATAFPDLKFRITEFDVDTGDEQLQGDYTRDFLTICFSHPQMLGFQMWGFWEGAHYRPRAAILRQDFTEKPNGTAWRELIFNQWQTDETRTTRTDGRVRGRGFLGDYDLTVEVGGQTVPGTLALATDGSSATVTVNVPIGGAPQVTIQPLGTTVSPGETVTLVCEGAGDPAPQISWFKDGVALNEHGAQLVIANADAGDEGVYHAEFTNSLGAVETRAVGVGVRAPAARNEKLINISTRAQVATGAGVMIVGFVIDGDKDVLLRGVGPRLGALGVPGRMADPMLRLFRSGEPTPFVENDDWDPALAPVMAQVQAFPLTGDTKSAALRQQLAAGAYTAHLSGVGDTQGVGLVEAYDVATGAPLKLINISTRGVVGTGSDVMIAGFVVQGSVPQKVLIRGIGPTLGGLGVPGTLADPTITLYEQTPGGGAVIAFNDDWSVGQNPAVIAAAAASVSAFSLIGYSRDASLLISLEPGSYTVHLAGANRATGIALAEVYAVP